jgi:diguanylate cyclase (GGDEF)-like protein
LFTYDITTLALLGIFSNLVFAAAAFAAWRMIPEERCLRDWGIALSCLALGAIELAARPHLHWLWTIPIGNALLLCGQCWVFISLCHLVGLQVRRWLYLLPATVATVTLCFFIWYTLIAPSLNIRLTLFSLEAAALCTASTWALTQNNESAIRRWMKTTIIIQAVGIPVYLLRAWVVWHGADIASDYSKTSSMMIALPGFLYLIYQVWMSVTMILALTARMRRKVVETLNFNRQILANSPLPTAIYRFEGDCVLINAAYAQLMESSRSILLKQNFRREPEWQRSGLVDVCDRALATRQPQRFEFRTSTQSDKTLWIDCSIRTAQIQGRTHLLMQFTDQTERKRLEDRLRQMAFHDPLTRLPNRRLLMDRLEQVQRISERDRSHSALVFIDLDRFKQLNDQHGHLTGDRLLIEVARTLSNAVRKSDTVARLGGDEFVVMLTGLPADASAARQSAEGIAGNIQRAVNRNYDLGQLRYPVSASLGLRLFQGATEPAEHLLNDADSAMYRSKYDAARRAPPASA